MGWGCGVEGGGCGGVGEQLSGAPRDCGAQEKVFQEAFLGCGNTYVTHTSSPDLKEALGDWDVVPQGAG